MNRAVYARLCRAALVAEPSASFAQGVDGDIVAAARAAIAAKDPSTLVSQYRPERGETPEALSWLERGALAAKDFDNARRCARDTHKFAVAALTTQRLDEDSRLQIALGAAIGTEAQGC